MEDNRKIGKIPPGLEKNEAFMEYQGLSREARESLRAASPEVTDIRVETQLRSQIDAMRDVIETQVEALKYEQARVGYLTGGLRAIASALAGAATKKTTAEEAVRLATGIVLTLDSQTLSESQVSPEGETLQ